MHSPTSFCFSFLYVANYFSSCFSSQQWNVYNTVYRWSSFPQPKPVGCLWQWVLSSTHCNSQCSSDNVSLPLLTIDLLAYMAGGFMCMSMVPTYPVGANKVMEGVLREAGSWPNWRWEGKDLDSTSQNQHIPHFLAWTSPQGSPWSQQNSWYRSEQTHWKPGGWWRGKYKSFLLASSSCLMPPLP